MSTMTEQMGQAGAGRPAMKGPGLVKKGEQFRCQTCGMAMQITADCRCNNPDHVHFQCCGQEMQKT